MIRAGLPVFVKVAGRPVMLLGEEGEAASAKRRLLERAGAVIVGEDGDARLAIVALAGEAADAAAVRLRQRGLLVNVVDRPDLCDFTLPAIVDRDPVVVAIGTGGVSAGLAAALRQRLETLLPAALGRLADAFGAARTALRACYPDGGTRRRAIAAALTESGPLDPLRAHDDPGDRLAALLADKAGIEGSETGTIERIAIASADPDSLTLRAARLLSQADRVIHPADMAPAILDRARADAERIAGPDAAFRAQGLTVELHWGQP